MTAILWVLHLLSSSIEKKDRARESKTSNQEVAAPSRDNWNSRIEGANKSNIFKLGLPSIQKLPGEVKVGAGAPD